MKSRVIIGLGLGVVGVIFAVLVFPIGGTGAFPVADIIPFDCAKAWDEMRSSLRTTDNDAFQKLSPEEEREIRKHDGLILDDFHANWCATNFRDWIDDAKDTDGRLAMIANNEQGLSWQRWIDTEWEYNEKFPDGAYQDW